MFLAKLDTEVSLIFIKILARRNPYVRAYKPRRNK